MKFRDLIRLAFESVFLYKFRSLLSILGITIGVAAVISGAILGVGNRESIMEKLAASGAELLWFYIKPEAEASPTLDSLGYTPELLITEEDLQYIKKQCSTVKDMAPLLLTPALLRYAGKYHTIKALGIMSPSSFRKLLRLKMVKGRHISDLDVESKAKVCVIKESEFSREVFGGEIPVGKYILVGEEKYKIIGTFGMIWVFGRPERLIAFFPFTSLRETLGIRKYSTVELTVKNVADVSKAVFQLKQALLQRFGHPLKFEIATYSEIVQTSKEIVSLITILILGIAIISLTVGGVGIMNVMMAMVVEQTREIGIAKAIGAKSGAILYLFLAQATILTLIGGVLGILLGTGASKLVTLLVRIPFIVPPWAIFLGFFLSLVVGIISGSYPAKRAAELDPAITLRQL